MKAYHLAAAVVLAALSLGCPARQPPQADAHPAIDWSRLQQQLLGTSAPDGTAGPMTCSQWERRCGEIRRRILSVLGPFPQGRRDASAKRLAQDRYRGLMRYKIAYPVGPNDTVKAWVLVPAGLEGKAPAVLCIHQTVPAGKDEPIGLVGPTNMHYALALSRRGYVTLTPDLITAGDRVPAGGKPFYTTDFYRAHPHWSATGKMVWDAMRAIDVLRGLAFVDPDRVGCMGHSLGGHVSLYTAALDPRVKAAVSNCGWQLFQADWQAALRFSRTRGFTYIPRLREHFLQRRTPYDHHEVLALIAPRAFLDIGDDNDPTLRRSCSNIRVVAMVRRVYDLYGRGDQLAVLRRREGHTLSAAAFEHVVAFFDRTRCLGAGPATQRSAAAGARH